MFNVSLFTGFVINFFFTCQISTAGENYHKECSMFKIYGLLWQYLAQRGHIVCHRTVALSDLLWYRVLNPLFWQRYHFFHENLSTVIQSWIVSGSCLHMLYGGNFEPFYDSWLFSPYCFSDFGSGFRKCFSTGMIKVRSQGNSGVTGAQDITFSDTIEKKVHATVFLRSLNHCYWNKKVTEWHKMLESSPAVDTDTFAGGFVYVFFRTIRCDLLAGTSLIKLIQILEFQDWELDMRR